MEGAHREKGHHLMPLPDAATLGTWTAFIVGVAALVFTVLSKTMGGVTDTQRTLRSMRKEREDARVADLTEDVHHLRGRVNWLAAESEHVWQLIHAHRPWDHQAMETIRSLRPDANIAPPPPLLPRNPIAQEATVAVALAEVHDAIDTIEAKATTNTPPGGIKLPPAGTDEPHKGRNT